MPETAKKSDYKATLQLPRTDFPMKANLPTREPAILKQWNALDVYALLMEARRERKPWVLHDGPPYANGAVHVGTALNKVLKDFIVRSRAMMGYRTPFVPGWDCHGMPIEHQVTRALGAKARAMPKLELRALCRAHAQKWIDIQRADFRRLGCLGDWEHPYLTFSPEYDAAEIGVLRRMTELGFVYRGRRPVHWCVECRTALAEAEIEYREHVSPSIYVAFRFNDRLGGAGALASGADGATLARADREGRLFALIWTTTPWTIPANLGVTLNPTFEYAAIESGGNFYVVAARLADAVIKACGLESGARIALSSEALRALDGKDVLSHPLLDRGVRLMFGDHVTADSGTGLVHTAPGHGYDDFLIGQRYGLEPLTPVDEAGVFTAESGGYAGRKVFEANDAITADLRRAGALVHAQPYSHSYPHCWRCGQALIFRATEQWFLGVERRGLRAQALAAIDGVQWVPGWARDRIRNMVEARPDWCLSRQRAWGVPIPALRCARCGHVALDLGVMKRAEEIFAREGSDAWYARPPADFAGDLRCEKCAGAEFTREEDVLDVWFDSGCSQAAVLERRAELTWPADAYVEGVDQARGWFQSSLLCACATRESAPYRTVVTHGLTQDELGRKMSKSLGNTEDVADVVKRIGADILRMVYASVDYAADMNIGEQLFGAVAEQYRKVRNTARFILGNLGDFEPARDALAPERMLEFDCHIMACAEQLKAEVRRAFERFDFQAAYHAIVNFVVVDLSALYVDVARDRLYCDAAASRERRSAQTALYRILDALLRMLAPLIPFTAEEIYARMPGERLASVHLLELAAPEPAFLDADLDARWTRLLKLRGEALKLLETMRQAGAIGAPLEAALAIGDGAGDADAAAALSNSRDTLKELFIVSDLRILDQDEAARMRARADGADFRSDEAFVRVSLDPPMVLIGRRAPGLKCARCWTYFDDHGHPELCPRCRVVVQA